MLTAIAGQGGAAFHPLTLPVANGAALDHAFWAEDPDLLGLAEGAAVGTWTDRGSLGVNATSSGSNRPTFSHSVAALNGRPGLVFDGVDDYMNCPVGGAAATQPLTIVVAVNIRSHAATDRVFANNSVSSSRIIFQENASGELNLYAGSAVTDPAGFTDGMNVFVAKYNGASSSLAVNGTTVLSGNAGTANLTNFNIGIAADESASTSLAGDFGLFYVFDEDVAAASWFAEWERGLLYHYGVLS